MDKLDLAYNYVDALGEILGVSTEGIIVDFEECLEVEAELEYLGDSDALILIRSDVEDDNLKVVLAHEMVHFQQHEEGRLIHGHMKVIWEGVVHTDVDYLSSPWEIEAYEKENTLAEML